MNKRKRSLSKPCESHWIQTAGASIAFMLWMALPGLGQGGRASVNGTVVDQSGAMVAGAKVVATNTETSQSRDTITADNGTYSIPLLPVGVYTVTCTHSGFKTSSQAT